MAMDKSAADAYVYAKASGMLAKSYVGSRSKNLFNTHSLAELWNLLFRKEVPVVPETLLAKELEKEAQRNFLSQYLKLLNNYSKPEKLLISLVHFYDYDNLKELGAALALGEKQMPAITDTKPYSLINYEKWPDLKSMTAESPLSWYNEVPDLLNQSQLDYKLDCQYIEEIWNAAKKVDSSCRKAVLTLLGNKFRMDNAIWALRLKIYYGMDNETIESHLAYSDPSSGKQDYLVQEALTVLEWDIDDYEKWKTWKYSALLNPHEEGVVWSVDPRWISNAYRRMYVEEAYRLFHLYPFTACPLVCWFIIKQNELDNIRTASESLRLNISSSQAMELAGVSEVKNG